MTTLLLLELFAGFLAAGMALWFVAFSRSSAPNVPGISAPSALLPTSGLSGRIRGALTDYFRRDGLLANTGLWCCAWPSA